MTASKLRPLAFWAAVALLFALLGWVCAFGLSARLVGVSHGGSLDWDAASAAWYLHHVARAVAGETPLFYSDALFYPHGFHLLGQDWIPLVGLLALPFQGKGPLFAFNLQLPLAYLLTGLFTTLLARRLGARPLWAVAAGLAFAFCELHLLKGHYQGQPAHLHQELMPLFLWLCWGFLMRSRLDRAAVARAVGAGVCFFAATFISPYQSAFLSLLCVLALCWGVGGALLRRERARAAALLRRWAAFAGLAGGSALLLALPVIWPNRAFLARATALVHADAEVHSGTDLSFYLTPVIRGVPSAELLLDEFRVVYLSLALCGLALLGAVALVRHRGPGPAEPAGTPGPGFWGAAALLFFLLSLGGTLVFCGQEQVSLPFFRALQALPLMEAVRFAPRYASVTVLGLALLAALGLSRLERGAAPLLRPALRWSLRALCLGLLLWDLLGGRMAWHLAGQTRPWPLPLPEANRLIAAEPGPCSVLLYPPVWEARVHALGEGAFPASRAFAYQLQHKKRLLNGFADYLADETLGDFEMMPLVHQLLAVRRGEPPELPAAALERIPATVRRLRLRFVLLHKRPPPGSPPWPYHAAEAEALIRRLLSARTVYEDDDALLLRLLW